MIVKLHDTCHLTTKSLPIRSGARFDCGADCPSTRPRGRGAAAQRDELAPVHSITSSERASSVGGTVMPIVFAVCRLMTISNFGWLLDRQVYSFLLRTVRGHLAFPMP
jgi:hypothetical protein